MKDRIRELMEMDGLNATEFSKKVKINTSVVSNILNAKNQPSFDVIQKIILAYPEVDVAWLMTGQGDIFGADTDSEETAMAHQDMEMSAESSLFADDHDDAGQDLPKTSFQKAENALSPTYPSMPQEKTKEKGRKRPSKPTYIANNQDVVVEEKPQKKIQKIIIVYQDNTFEEILPQE